MLTQIKFDFGHPSADGSRRGSTHGRADAAA
nr:MAG TPA: hypothetical protein [Caudoviricetes sp.]